MIHSQRIVAICEVMSGAKTIQSRTCPLHSRDVEGLREVIGKARKWLFSKNIRAFVRVA